MDRTPSARTENPTFNVRPSSENLYFGIYNSDNGPIFIPHICHFFYTDRIFENQILHPKKRLKSPKTLKMSLKKSYICIFFTHSGKIYTWQKIFTQTCLWCLWQIKGMIKSIGVVRDARWAQPMGKPSHYNTFIPTSTADIRNLFPCMDYSKQA